MIQKKNYNEFMIVSRFRPNVFKFIHWLQGQRGDQKQTHTVSFMLEEFMRNNPELVKKFEKR